MLEFKVEFATYFNTFNSGLKVFGFRLCLHITTFMSSLVSCCYSAVPFHYPLALLLKYVAIFWVSALTPHLEMTDERLMWGWSPSCCSDALNTLIINRTIAAFLNLASIPLQTSFCFETTLWLLPLKNCFICLNLTVQCVYSDAFHWICDFEAARISVAEGFEKPNIILFDLPKLSFVFVSF